jgi:DNA-binding Xre family transcriptional regulator
MKPCYDRLWHTLIDKKLKKKDLTSMANISTATMNKMVHEEWVALEVIGRICKVLECDVSDVVSFTYND